MKKKSKKPEMTEERKAKILAACAGLKKMFGKRKWFDFVGTGDADGEFTLLVGSKTKPSARRVNQCVEYMGFPVVICGPWE